jgi:hypothetical protein
MPILQSHLPRAVEIILKRRGEVRVSMSAMAIAMERRIFDAVAVHRGLFALRSSGAFLNARHDPLSSLSTHLHSPFGRHPLTSKPRINITIKINLGIQKESHTHTARNMLGSWRSLLIKKPGVLGESPGMKAVFPSLLEPQSTMCLHA